MNDEYAMPALPAPSRGVRALDRLIGTWKVTGGAEGEVTYRWMEGGYFLLQDVRLEQLGQVTTGLEVIGNLRQFGEEPSADVHSRYYDNTGATFDYVYELDGDTLTIWGGEKGSPVKFVGTFDETGDVMAGEWDYAGQGGYESTMTRV